MDLLSCFEHLSSMIDYTKPQKSNTLEEINLENLKKVSFQQLENLSIGIFYSCPMPFDYEPSNYNIINIIFSVSSLDSLQELSLASAMCLQGINLKQLKKLS